MEEFHASSDRVASVTIRISKRYKIRVVQVYAPTSLSSQEELDEFYEDLYTEMKYKKAHFNIIMGDFNAKVGNFGYGIRNERGDDLINFAIANRLKIMNTFFKKKPNKRWTWHSPNFENFNEIDYVLTDKSSIVRNIEVLNQVKVDSDHRMVRCKVKIDTKRERQKLFHSKPAPLRVPQQHVNKFKFELKNRYAILEEQPDFNYKNIGLNDLNDNNIKPLVDAEKNCRSSSEKANKFSE